MGISRRLFATSALGAVAIAAARLARPTRATTEFEDIRDLKPGQFVWYPEGAPAGP